MSILSATSAVPVRRQPIGRAVLIGLFVLGLLLRLPGILFNGQLDLDTLIFLWGTAVKQLGLGAGFQENYGPFSFAVYGISASLAEQLPRFWWLPYKLIEIALEIGLLVVLYQLLTEERKRWTLIVYWLNPWFILHGAWQGFWEGAHTLCALLAVVVLARTKQPRRAWLTVGALLMASALFKPQGLLHFLLPLAVYLIVQMERGYWATLKWYVQGSLVMLGGATAWLVLTGGGWLSILRNYVTATTIMPNLCNGCLSVWRPISTLLQAITGQTGPTYTLQLPTIFSTSVQLLTFGLIVYLMILFFSRAMLVRAVSDQPTVRQLTRVLQVTGLILALAAALEWFLPAEAEKTKWLVGGVPINYSFVVLLVLLVGLVIALAAPVWARVLYGVWQRLVRYQRWPNRPGLTPANGVYLVLATSSLLLAQLGTRSHINHTYATLILLIPLALSNRRALIAWAVMMGVNFYGHLATYQLGRSTILPDFFATVPTASSLVGQIQAVVKAAPMDALLQIQMDSNRVLATLPQEPLISILAIGQFVSALVILKTVWDA
ncbi:MAG: hypothetical protein KA765_01135, partial [Thermoflexales bacterium]|nr:hypothetical protein [Thermoflexales bacterium]